MPAKIVLFRPKDAIILTHPVLNFEKLVLPLEFYITSERGNPEDVVEKYQEIIRLCETLSPTEIYVGLRGDISNGIESSIENLKREGGPTFCWVIASTFFRGNDDKWYCYDGKNLVDMKPITQTTYQKLLADRIAKRNKSAEKKAHTVG